MIVKKVTMRMLDERVVDTWLFDENTVEDMIETWIFRETTKGRDTTWAEWRAKYKLSGTLERVRYLRRNCV